MESKLKTIRIFSVIKLILVAAGFVSATILLFRAPLPETPVGSFFIAYLCLLTHAIWAYKKTSVFFHAAGIFAYTSVIVYMTKSYVIADPQITPCFPVLVLLTASILTFILTFRNYEKVAAVVGLIMVALALVHPVIILFTVLVGNGDMGQFFGTLPFASFILTSTLYFSFMARLTWKKAGKPTTEFI